MNKFLAILDECVDQEKLVKMLAKEYAEKAVLDVKAKIESGEIDPVKGTELDKEVMLKAVNFVLAQIGA
jgi:hypothetical protein